MPRHGCGIQFDDGHELLLFPDGLSLYDAEGGVTATLRFDGPSDEQARWWLSELASAVEYLSTRVEIQARMEGFKAIVKRGLERGDAPEEIARRVRRSAAFSWAAENEEAPEPVAWRYRFKHKQAVPPARGSDWRYTDRKSGVPARIRHGGEGVYEPLFSAPDVSREMSEGSDG